MRVSWAPIVFVAFFAVAGCQSGKVITPAQIEAMIQQEVPVGASRESVKSFLMRHGAEFGEGENSNSIEAIIRKSRPGWVTFGNLQMRFRFDAQENLVSHEVKEVFTGP